MFHLPRFRLLFTLILLSSLFLSALPVRAQAGSVEDHAGGARDHLQVVLQADGAPAPGGKVHLSFNATPLLAVPGLEVQWFLPTGAVLQGSATDTYGALAANQTVSSERWVSFPSAGIYKVAVSASFDASPSATFSAAGVLFFTITPNGSRVSDQDPEARSPMHSTMATTVTSGPPQPLQVNAPNGDPCFSIQGSVVRTDMPPTSSGYGTAVTVPVRYAMVDIREEDTIFDDSYGVVITDENGQFSRSFCDDDGWFDDTLEIYVRVRAELKYNGAYAVEVEDSSWIDEVYEYDSSVVSSGGGTLTFDMGMDTTQSGVFNVADAALDAWTFWQESGGNRGSYDNFNEEAEIHWEPGYGDDGSYYNPFWEEITIADDPSDPDQWDDSVIMHEFGHATDDEFSCDDNPGGDHYINKPVDDSELAWGEGYPDYWQSAVRLGKGYSFANYYLDINGTGVSGIKVNLETYDVSQPTILTPYNELAIAAALWDLNDSTNDGQDRVGYGHATIQSVFTSSAFMDAAYGFWDDTCDFYTYMRGWIDSGQPTDAATAAAIYQNTEYNLPASLALAGSGNNNSPTRLMAVNASPASDPSTYRWWKELTYVADNSASMTGPKFDAVKALLTEAVNDLGDDPEGTEFTLQTFNNTSATNQVQFTGQFFPDDLLGPISSLAPIADADADCNVYALSALAQAVQDRQSGDVWLLTDGDTYQSPSVDNLRQMLNDQQLRASVALMGLCATLNETGASLTKPTLTELQALPPEAQQQRMAEWLAHGAAQAALGPTAGDVPGGLVPYLLTALNSGGQFLYVDSSQLDNATDILRAQITNSAGAGRWSDYVSDVPTYQWDNLATWEYAWQDAYTNGTIHGNPAYDSYLDIPLPGSFTYYGVSPYNSIKVFQDGYLTFGDHLTASQYNTTLPNPLEPNNALYPFWDDMEAVYVICANSPAPDCGYVGTIATYSTGDWFVIEYYEYNSYTTSPWPINNFEVLLNMSTGEIRYQYQDVPDGTGSATIGIEDSSGSNALQVSYNDYYGASGGMGYKFTPVPPQPTKTYTVTVDSTMGAVGFLLAGYSGSFEPLAVYDPDGNLLSCGEAGALCLNLDLVQYAQFNANGRTGDWHAVVDAGPTGAGTFSFTSFAASPIQVESRADHMLSTVGPLNFLIDLGQAADGGMLTGWLLTPDGLPFGSAFSLYDDGTHGDGKAGDGNFGSDGFTPPGAGRAYLWVQGLIGGTQFVRQEAVPYSFQPVTITSLGDGANYGAGTDLQFEVTNLDAYAHCYWYTYQAPDGWWVDGLGFFPIVCLDPGETWVQTATVYMTAGYTNDLPSGTTGQVTLSVTEWEKGEMSDSATATVTRRRLPASIVLDHPTTPLAPNGSSMPLEVQVLDEQGVAVADGTEVQLSATAGLITPATGYTQGGFIFATFTSDATLGMVTINVSVSTPVLGPEAITASTQIEVSGLPPDQIVLTASASQLPSDGTSTALLVVTVTDGMGQPVAGQLVRLGIEGDEGQMGLVDGGETVEAYTDAQGQVSATYTSGTLTGIAYLRAELLTPSGADYIVSLSTRTGLQLGTFLFLPMAVK
jgi:hypothetical protein